MGGQNSLRDFWDTIKRDSINIPEGEGGGKETETTFKEIMAEYLPSLGKDIEN